VSDYDDSLDARDDLIMLKLGILAEDVLFALREILTDKSSRCSFDHKEPGLAAWEDRNSLVHAPEIQRRDKWGF
jgi:hypothetical protein